MLNGVSADAYRGHRFPREIISYAVWFYYRFAVSFREGTVTLPSLHDPRRRMTTIQVDILRTVDLLRRQPPSV